MRYLGLCLSVCLLSAASVRANPTLEIGCWPSGIGASYIETINPDGTSTTLASGLTFPGGLAYDSGGHLTIAEQVQLTDDVGIAKISPGGVVGPVTDVNVGGIAFCETADTSGNLYIGTSTMSGGVTKIDPAGNSSLYAPLTVTNPNGTLSQFGVRAMTFSDGVMYATSGSSIFQINSNGTFKIFATGDDFLGLVADGSGNLFATDVGAGTVDKISSTGQVSVFASGFANPLAICIDSTGNLFEANAGDGTVDEISPAGVVTPYASGLIDPSYIAVAPVPEPSTVGVLLVGIVGLVRRRGFIR